MSTKKIYTNAIAQIGGKVATAFISIFLIKILTGYLDVAGYGLYSKVYNYLSIFAVIADLGLYTITVRELSKYQDNPKKVEEISGNILSLRTLSGLIIIILSLIVALFLSSYNSSTALISILIVSIFTLFGLINSSIMSYLQSILKTEFSFIANVCGKMFSFGLIVFFAFFILKKGDHPDNMRLYAVLIAGLMGNIVMTSLTWWYASKYQKIRFLWNSRLILSILKSSLPYGLALFFGVIFFKVDIILLSIMEPVEHADTIVALYALPMKIVEVGMMYGTVFLNSLLPVLTTAIESKDQNTTKKLTKEGFELLFGFGAGISVFLAFFAPEITRIISTQDFVSTSVYGYNTADVMRIVAWIFLFYFVSSLSNYILIAQGEQGKIMKINAFIALLNIIGNIIIIPHYSSIGSAWVTLFSQLVLIIISWYLVRDLYQNIYQLQQGIFFVITAIISGLIALSISSLLHIFALSNIVFIFARIGLGGIVFSVLYLSSWWTMRKLLS